MKQLTGHQTRSGRTSSSRGLIWAINTVRYSITTLPGANTTPIGTSKLASSTADCTYNPTATAVLMHTVPVSVVWRLQRTC